MVKHKVNVETDSSRSDLSRRNIRKREIRENIENATINMIQRYGYRDMTVEQIAKEAGTTRTTFYKYYKKKTDLIEFIQESRIAPEITKVCLKLDALEDPSWKDIRNWVNAYRSTWLRIRIYFEAYSEAIVGDPEVIAKIGPQTEKITSQMTNLLGRFPPEEHKKVKGKVELILLMLASLMFRLNNDSSASRSSPLLDYAADMIWGTLFASNRKT